MANHYEVQVIFQGLNITFNKISFTTLFITVFHKIYIKFRSILHALRITN